MALDPPAGRSTGYSVADHGVHPDGTPLSDDGENDVLNKDIVASVDDAAVIDYASASTYNIYSRKDAKEHYIITPLVSPDWEKVAPPRKSKRTAFDVFKDEIPKDAAENSFFVHKPYLSFHHAPRTLRRGPHKDSPVVCLVNNSWFWRKWILQFGEKLAEDGVIDPRGVVSEKHGEAKRDKKGLTAKGYKVRTWRLWGESGKRYHQEFNEERKAGWIQPDQPEKVSDKPLIEDVVYFSWHSPFTHKTRHYCFNYAGLEFYWKGTGTVKESRTCGWWLRFNHVKLCVRLPIETTVSVPRGEGPIRRTTTWGSVLSRFSTNHAGFREVCLAKYTSSMAMKKAGILRVYDDTLHALLIDDVIPLADTKKSELKAAGIIGVKKLELYEIVIATAMCMVIGEWQKRETLWTLLSIAGEGGGAG